MEQEQIKLTINGKEVVTVPGKTILEVVHENEIDRIPTLCHDERIEPYGSCFLCVVEVEGLNRMVASCCTPVAPGMKVHTDNERIRNSRRTALELLLSNHYADCIGPCINNCPANVDAQGYIALISAGKFQEALTLIKKQNPLPLSIGRVCVRDCEVACRRKIVDEAIGINYLKRYVADLDAPHKWKPEVKPTTGKKVAVVGGGPSGLTCAYYLTLEGHKVTIFEKLSRLGGMLMYGIPEYRLPKKTLQDEINWILSVGHGVDVKTNVEMGKDFNTESLLKEGFDSVYLAVGAHKASTMRLEHEEDTEGILWGIDFLRQLPDTIPQLKGTVCIVGGGNTAIDAARTALRCGADKVKIVYRRSIKEMPANEEEIHAAQAEGIEINILTLPTAIIRDDNKKLKGLVCIKMKLEEAAPGERPRPVPIEGSEYEIPCDYLIGAIGQAVDINFSKQDTNLKLERWGTIITDEKTLETSIKGVFAGGDVVIGPFTAIASIAHGKRAAISIDEYLRTGEAVKRNKPFLSFKHKFAEVSEHELAHFAKVPRTRMPELPEKQRIDCFDEVELGLTDEQAAYEPKRCIECGCSEYYDCQLRLHADDFGVDITNYLGETRKYSVDTRHPFIVMDPNKCINCGRCVRTCSEILKVSALGFVNRGFRAVVKPAMEKALAETNCIACGNCIDTCPTGALTERFPFKVLGTLPKENHEAVCNFCSIGCKVNFKVLHDDIYYVSNSEEGGLNDSHNRGYLCIKGRFGHRFLSDKNRLTTPLIKGAKGFEKAGWEKAVDFAAGKIKSVIDKYGPGAVAVLGSPKMSNEELYLLQKFARVGLKTNNVGSFSNLLYGRDLDALDETIGYTNSTASMDDIRDADLVIVMNGNLSEENLVMEMKIKDARKNRGTKLVLINSSEIKLTKFADLWIDSRKGTNTILLNGIMRDLIEKGLVSKDRTSFDGFDALKESVTPYTPWKVTEDAGITAEKYDQLLEWIEKPGQKVVFIYNIDSPQEKSKNDLKAAGNLLLLTGHLESEGSGLIITREYANSAGLMDMGLTTDYLPGYVKSFETGEIGRIAKIWNTDLETVFKPVNLEEKLLQGEIKALLVFGEDPLIVSDNLKYLKDVEFLLVQDMFQTDTAAEAHVVLPAASYVEQNGSFTACDNRVQTVERVVPSKTGMENWQVIQSLAQKFTKDFDYNSAAGIFEEIETVNRFYNEDKPGCFNKTGKPCFVDYNVDTTTLNPELPTLLYSENYYKTKIKSQLR
jgi:formate dehydrogenase major subunit